MTFGLLYAFSENFVLPLSHDEVVYGKGSLIRKMPGDDWQRFANLRAYFGFMWGHPGKKLLFMGGEIAQWDEWNHDGAIAWHLLDSPQHLGVQRLVRDLNQIYRQEPALHCRDSVSTGFRWVVGDDTNNSVFAFIRQAAEDDSSRPVLVVCNMTPVPRTAYMIGVPRPGYWQELINSDSDAYGGSGLGNCGGAATLSEPRHGEAQSLSLTLPPLATVYLAPAARQPQDANSFPGSGTTDSAPR
jgi:1,4-alpha-glucan branching enzyme